MSKILWIIARPKETIKFIFNVNFIEKWVLKRIMMKKKIKFIKKTGQLKGQMFESVIIDEINEWGVKNG